MAAAITERTSLCELNSLISKLWFSRVHFPIGRTRTRPRVGWGPKFNLWQNKPTVQNTAKKGINSNSRSNDHCCRSSHANPSVLIAARKNVCQEQEDDVLNEECRAPKEKRADGNRVDMGVKMQKFGEENGDEKERIPEFA